MEFLYKADRTKHRIWELDFLRGLAILLMVFDHACYDLSGLPPMFSNWASAGEFWHALQKFGFRFLNSDLRMAGHYAFAGLFFLMTGISCALSKSNLTRGLQLLGVSLCLTLGTQAVTLYSGIDVLILFGVLQCMAVSILIECLVKKAFGEDWWLLVFGVLFVLGGIVIEWYGIPYVGEATAQNVFEIMLGLKKFGADHFGLLPCAGVLLIGSFIGRTVYADRRSLMPRLDGAWNRPVCCLGRNTLVVYVLHQVALFALIGIAALLTGLKFNF